jgi:endoglucanase
MHHEDWHFPSKENEAVATQQLSKVWKQIATQFQAYDEHLIFEAMNEPRKIGTAQEWNGGDTEGHEVVNQFNQVFVDTVRTSGGNNANRFLMVPTYAASSSVNALLAMKVPADDHIIVSVHAYTPYDFALNEKGTAKWQENTKDIDNLMKNLQEQFLDRDIPVILGEFGARNKDNLADRVAWATYYVDSATSRGIPCVWWDNGLFNGTGELFGLIDRTSNQWVFPEIVDVLTQAR